jgi:hypothetical protein
MPKDFEKCVASKGSRTRTVKPKGKGSPEYLHVCFDKQGKSHAGEVKKARPRIARLEK